MEFAEVNKHWRESDSLSFVAVADEEPVGIQAAANESAADAANWEREDQLLGETTTTAAPSLPLR